MNRALAVEKTVEIGVNPMVVWNALTDREIIKQYFFGTEAISDWNEGSTLMFQGEWEGKTYRDKGFILAAEPGKLLQYSYWSGFSGLEDIPENYSVVTYKLDGDENETTVHLVQEGFASEEAMAHGEGGWTMVLENLKNLLGEG